MVKVRCKRTNEDSFFGNFLYERVIPEDHFLDEHGIPFRLINPFTFKRRREGEDINRRKNDFRDAEMAAELVRTGKLVNTRLPYGMLMA